jgi:hypothetical protein
MTLIFEYTSGPLARYLRSPPHRLMLRPVGEALKGATRPPSHGLHLGLFRAHNHHSKRGGGSLSKFPHQKLTLCGSYQHCVLSVYRSMRAILHSTQGGSVDQYLNPPYPSLEIFRLGLFQVQIVVGDIIMVPLFFFNPLKFAEE